MRHLSDSFVQLRATLQVHVVITAEQLGVVGPPIHARADDVDTVVLPQKLLGPFVQFNLIA